MNDAEVIPIGTRGRPGRGTGRSRPSSAARNLAPKPRTSSRSVPTPPDPDDVAGTPREPAGASEPTAATSDTVTGDRGGLRGIPIEDWLAALETGAKEVLGDDWEVRLARFVRFLRHRVAGDYPIDDYGFDPEVTDRFVMAALRPIAQKWFRLETRGLDNIPAQGGALVVSNHSGTLPVDGLMTMSTIYDNTGRHLRPLGADLVFRMPVISAIARKTGATLACNEDAERMLSGGELVGVWPEGFKGIGKPFSERYRLQRFGRGGFVSAAMRTGVPIIPLSVVGAEEIYPLVGNVPALARLLGVPYLPVTPTFPLLGPLGLVPLPSKWIMEFGDPIRTDELGPGASEDPMLVFNVTDQVRETIQQTLYRLLMDRESVFG